jgi:hypothetical protein
MDTAAIHRDACARLGLKAEVINGGHDLLGKTYGVGGASLVTSTMTLASRRATDIGDATVLGRILSSAGAQAKAMDQTHRQGPGGRELG